MDDGDRVGHTYENFPIEMNLALRFPTPQSYVYMSKNPQTIIRGIKMENSESVVGIYALKFIDMPLQNDRGWGLYIQTEYLDDKLVNHLTIDFNSLFTQTLKDVIKYTREQFLSPYIFIDIDLYDVDGVKIKSKIDWNTLIVDTDDDPDRQYQKIAIGVYIDNTYLNESVVTMNNSSSSRMNRSKTQ